MRKVVLLVLSVIMVTVTMSAEFIDMVKIKEDKNSRYGYILDTNIIRMNSTLIATIKPLMDKEKALPVSLGNYKIYDVRYMYYYSSGGESDLYIILNQYVESDKSLDYSMHNYLEFINQANFELSKDPVININGGK